MDSRNGRNSKVLRITPILFYELKALPTFYLLLFGVPTMAVTDDCFDQLSVTNQELKQSLSEDPDCGCSSLYVQKDAITGDVDDEAENHLTCRGCKSWDTIGNFKYMIPYDKGTFQEARSLCQKCGGDVAVFNTTDLRATIEVIMNEIREPQTAIWIGITRVPENRTLFEWLDGRGFSGTDNSWGLDQPNDSSPPQDCVVSFLVNSWRLEDKRCTRTYYPLCERNLVP